MSLGLAELLSHHDQGIRPQEAGGSWGPGLDGKPARQRAARGAGAVLHECTRGTKHTHLTHLGPRKEVGGYGDP